ncbi:hypothetical protein PMIN06_001925 [Paraphaeosphaeria minitans]
MLKTSIFEGIAGHGEPESGAKAHGMICDMAAQYGMYIDKDYKSSLAQVATKRFCVETQPEMTYDAIRLRIASLRRGKTRNWWLARDRKQVWQTESNEPLERRS